MTAPPKIKVTAGAFYAIAAASDQRLELIDGEIVVIATPLIIHFAGAS